MVLPVVTSEGLGPGHSATSICSSSTSDAKEQLELPKSATIASLTSADEAVDILSIMVFLWTGAIAWFSSEVAVGIL